MKNLFVSLLIGMTIVANSQNVEFKKKNFEDQEGFKIASQSLKDGDKQFFAGDYSQALVFYKDAYKFNPNNAKLNFKMGVAHLKSEEKAKALDYFLKAKELDPQVDPKLNFAMAQAYQENKQYKTAINTYKGYLVNLSPSEKPSIEPKVNEKIKECEEAGGMDAVTEVKQEPIVEKETVIEKPKKEVNPEIIAPAIIDKEVAEPITKTVEKEKEKEAEKIEETKTIVATTPKVEQKAPIEQKTTPKSSATVYKIQLVATSRDLTQNEIKKLYSGSKKVEIDKVNGVNKYLIGGFTTKTEAQSFIKNVSVKDAFVVKYKNGKRVY